MDIGARCAWGDVRGEMRGVMEWILVQGGGLGWGKVISVFNFHPLSEVQKPRLNRSFIASNSDSPHPTAEFRFNR